MNDHYIARNMKETSWKRWILCITSLYHIFLESIYDGETEQESCQNFFFLIYVQLHQVFVAAQRIFDLRGGAQDLQLQHVGSSFPDQRSNLGPLHWEHGVLATGPPGKSPLSCQNFNSTKFSLDQPGCSLFHPLTPKLDSSERVQMKDHKIETQIRNIFDAMICVIQISDWEWWSLFSVEQGNHGLEQTVTPSC